MKKLSVVLVILLLFTFRCKTQVSQREMDSLISMLPTVKDPQQKIELLNEVAWNIAYVDFKKGITYSLEAVQLAKKAKYYRGLVKAYNTLGSTYTDMGVYDEAVHYFELALKLSHEHKEIDRFEGVVLFNLSRIYSFRKNSQKALGYALDAYHIIMQEKDSSAMVMIGAALAELFFENGQMDSSQFYFKQAIEVGRVSKNPYHHAVARMQYGLHLVEQKNYEAALDQLAIAEKLLHELDINYDLFSVYVSYGIIAYERGQYEKAIVFLKTALSEYGTNVTLGGQRDAWQHLSNTYKQLKRFDDAFSCQTKFIELSDSINNESNKNQLMAMEVKFMNEKNQLQLAKLQAQNAFQVSIIEKQRLYTYIGIGGCLALFVIALLFYRSYKNKKRDHGIILSQKQIVEAKNKEILDSISYAKRIQDAILPTPDKLEQLPGENFVFYQPKDIVAGDFYWLEKINKQIVFAVCDCTGHGVPGALVSVVCHNALNRSLREYGLIQTGSILDKTRELVVEQFRKSNDNVKDGMDITLCVFNPETNQLIWSGANIPLWILRKEGVEMEEYKPDKQPIGYVDKPQPFTSLAIELKKGDTIYLFSDGYADQFGGESGKKLKAANLKKALIDSRNFSLQKQKTEIQTYFSKWKGNNEQIDDVCIVAIRI